MNYRHAFHVGNFADVFKHIILSRIIVYMQRKEKAFRIYDTHSGPGFYDLSSTESGKTNEWQDGFGKIQKAYVPENLKKIVAPWLEAVEAATDGYYPGSPKISRHLMRKQDRLSLYELHPEDFLSLKDLFSNDYQSKVFNLDGWLATGAHLPPKEGRGLMLIDPPFEDGHDFDRMIDAMEKARKRWSGGTMALWYPVKNRFHTDEWLGTLKSLQFPDTLNAEIYIREPRPASSLNGCGMVIVNPPFTLEKELKHLLPWLADVMSQGKGFGHRIQKL